MTASAAEFAFSVEKADRGKRLDLFLADHLPAVSRSQIQRLIREGSILLNAGRTKVGARVKDGDFIGGVIPQPRKSEVIPENLPLTFLYEDQDIAVVDKPAGMVVHPAGKVTTGTLVNALLYRLHDLQGVGGVLRPGIVHRLDKGTSGVMVVAKNDLAHDALVRQFKERAVTKIYLALVYGRTEEDEGTINSPVGRHPTDRKRFSLRTRAPKEAFTRWRVIERFNHVALLEVSPKTGRTHQIRVHLSALGHPLMGDTLYTKKKWLSRIDDPHLKEEIGKLERQALHASLISFRHPSTGQTLDFTAPLPGDINAILEVLRGRRV